MHTGEKRGKGRSGAAARRPRAGTVQQSLAERYPEAVFTTAAEARAVAAAAGVARRHDVGGRRRWSRPVISASPGGGRGRVTSGHHTCVPRSTPHQTPRAAALGGGEGRGTELHTQLFERYVPRGSARVEKGGGEGWEEHTGGETEKKKGLGEAENRRQTNTKGRETNDNQQRNIEKTKKKGESTVFGSFLYLFRCAAHTAVTS